MEIMIRIREGHPALWWEFLSSLSGARDWLLRSLRCAAPFTLGSG